MGTSLFMHRNVSVNCVSSKANKVIKHNGWDYYCNNFQMLKAIKRCNEMAPWKEKTFFFTLKLVSFMHFYAKTTFCIIHFDLWVSLLYFTNACINKGKYWTICGFWNVFTLDQSWYFICALKVCILCLCSMVTRKLYMCFLFKTPRHKYCKKIFSFFLYCLEGERSVST